MDNRLYGCHLVSIRSDNKGVGALIGLNGGRVIRPDFLGALSFIQPVNILHDPGEHIGYLGGLGILQVNDLHVTALLKRGIKILHQVPNPRPLQLVTTDQDAVGTGIRYQ